MDNVLNGLHSNPLFEAGCRASSCNPQPPAASAHQAPKGNVLHEIVKNKSAELERSKSSMPLRKLRALCRDRTQGPRDFSGAIRRQGRLSIIAEIKMASPSSGRIVSGKGYADMARAYQGSGFANAISAVTERRYFGGELGSIEAIKGAVSLPVLRKDFIVDEYQIYESYAAGADAILLIAAILDRATLKGFIEIAEGLGMPCLVETHDAPQIDRALSAGAKIIGINSRDLGDFSIDKDLFGSLAPRIPQGVTRVAESGIETAEDSRRLRRAGADAILVGTSLLKASDIAAKLREIAGIDGRRGNC